ncbi:MICOS complex subunit MIC13 homolog QIL1 [Drosophila bipectinata]|uniref:MICOS complex subunit MIC13 homolog QIL1 n=1 Tax=Drosophila bipectinata TaxID=42026 RepID=UPI001C895E37|nr:MICOS complex subunit MIC13 homolog QIL1 [Drosophila bipectinata]
MFTNIMARTAALSMTVYMSSWAGIWGQTEETHLLCRKIGQKLEPLSAQIRQRLLPTEVADMDVAQLARTYYNQGVKGSFQFIRDLPTHSTNLFEWTKATSLKLSSLTKMTTIEVPKDMTKEVFGSIKAPTEGQKYKVKVTGGAKIIRSGIEDDGGHHQIFEIKKQKK